MHLFPFLSAAKSSCKSAIGSPFTAKTDAVNGKPAAAWGYTPQPCGVGLLVPLTKIAVKSLIFTDILVSYFKSN